LETAEMQKENRLIYTIVFTPIPYVWRADNSIQGKRKMFYLNPFDYFQDAD